MFVDDFINVAQGGPRRLANVRRILYHNIDKVFRPLEDTDPSDRSRSYFGQKATKGRWRLGDSQNHPRLAD